MSSAVTEPDKSHCTQSISSKTFFTSFGTCRQFCPCSGCTTSSSRRRFYKRATMCWHSLNPRKSVFLDMITPSPSRGSIPRTSARSMRTRTRKNQKRARANSSCQLKLESSANYRNTTYSWGLCREANGRAAPSVLCNQRLRSDYL